MTSAQTNKSDWLLDDGVAPGGEGDPLAPLYEGGARGELVLPFCGTCRLSLDLEQLVCDGCGSFETVWRAAEPLGTVHSVTVMHRAEPGLVHADGPYPIVDVELADGHRLILTTLESTRVTPTIGDTVRVAFRYLGGVAIPAALPTTPAEKEATS